MPSMQAMRLPKGGKPKSHFVAGGNGQFNTYHIAPEDLELAGKLIKAGDAHAKAIRGIVVWASITAPIYWWREMETHRAGHERLSCESTMHIDCKGLTGEQLVQAKAAMPMGKEQTAIDTYSYQCLRNIYKLRRHHRLPQWQQFCQWVESLPFAAELITIGID